MEDVLYYIGLGLIISFSLVRRVGKAAARKASKQGSAPHPEPASGFPAPESVIYEYTKAKNAKNVKPQSVTIRVDELGEAQSLETIIDEEEEYMMKQVKDNMPKNIIVSKPVQSKPAAKPKAPIVAKSPKNSANNEGGAVLEDFDLREAVIYSEIMNPKFNE